MRRAAAPARLVDVAPSPFVFDVDLGTDAAGRTVAGYSRCTSRKRLPWRARCRLFELDPGTQAERPLAEVARRGFSQVRPAINRGILAYAEVPPTRRRGRARIALKRLGTATPSRTVKTFATTDPGDALGIDYEDERLAFAVSETEDDSVTRTLSLKEPGDACGRSPSATPARRTTRYGTQRMRRVRRPSFEDPPAGLSLRDSLGLPSP